MRSEPGPFSHWTEDIGPDDPAPSGDVPNGKKKNKASKRIKEIQNKLKRTPKVEAEPLKLSTGCTVINLACSGDPRFGLFAGHFYLFVGASAAGKTWLAKQVTAEAANHPEFDQYHFYEDNPERGALMNLVKYFGKKMAERIEPPPITKKHSILIEDFYDNLDDAIRKGESFIYVLDSEDALESEADVKKQQQGKKARRRIKGEGKEEKVAGTYGTDKAKKNSAGLRGAHNGLEATRSILIIIKQSRDVLNPDYGQDKQTRSGGRALTFYASLELWFELVKKIKKKVGEKKRPIGSVLRIHVKKNRIWGRDRAVEVLFYPSYGIDEVGTNIHYLVSENHWEVKGQGDTWEKTIVAPEFNFEGKMDKLIKLIEADNREAELRSLVSEKWAEIEELCSVDKERKKRYQ